MSEVDDLQLTELEQRLVDAFKCGDVLDLTSGEPADEFVTESWGQDRVIRARVIRDIVRGVHGAPDPRGLQLRGARVVGCVDLMNVNANLNLALLDCFMPDGLLLRYCSLLRLDLTGSRIERTAESTDSPVDATGLTARTVVLTRTNIIGNSALGSVNLAGSSVEHLICLGAQLHNTAGPALNAEVIKVDNGLLLTEGFIAVGAGNRGAVRLFGAHLGQLECDGARLDNASGPALDGERLQVDRNMHLRVGFSAAGAGDRGAVCLMGARIGGVLDCREASLNNTSGPALNSPLLEVGQLMFLGAGFEAEGASSRGTVRLIGAHLGQLECDGARLENASGPALDAASLLVDRHVLLRAGFKAAGAGDRGAVCLIGARIGGVLDCTRADLSNTSGPAFNSPMLDVGQDLLLHNEFKAASSGRFPVINLFGASIAGRFWLDIDPKDLERSDERALVDFDGLTYSALRQLAPLRLWLQLLGWKTPAYAAQPYQQLAAVHRAAGHDQDVRNILIAQRRDQIRRSAVTGRDRVWARLTGVTLGFGYQPWRALLLLLAVLATAVALAVTLGHYGGLAHTSRTTDPGGDCSVIEQVGVGLDLGTPLLRTGVRDLCAPTATAAGGVLTVAGWILQVLAWAFASLFIAGFTGVVRKT